MQYYSIYYSFSPWFWLNSIASVFVINRCKNGFNKKFKLMHLQFWPNIFQTKPFYKHQQKTKHFILWTGHNTLFESHRICTSTFYRALEGQKKFCSFSCKSCFGIFILYQIVRVRVYGIQRTESWCCSKPMIVYHHRFNEKRVFIVPLILSLPSFATFSFTSKKFSRQPKKISRFQFFALLAWHLCGLWRRLRCSPFFKRGKFS